MSVVSTDVLALVFARLREVQQTLGLDASSADDPEWLLADLLDSMALVELLAVLAAERGVSTAAIERAAGHHFSTVASLAAAVERAVLVPASASASSVTEPVSATCWLSASQAYLPRQIEEAHELDARLGRPAGWLETHAGIRRRHVWQDEDAIAAAARMGRVSLDSVGLLLEDVGALLVTSQAPPLLAGLAATLHQRLNLPPRCVALEVGGACTGFLQALWLARSLLVQLETVLVIAVEAPSRHLAVQPGPAGEAAALFGDGAASCLVTRTPAGSRSLPLLEVDLSLEAGGELLQVEGDGVNGVRLLMDGPRLASRAVECLANLVSQSVQRHKLSVKELAAVIVHGGNGRLPALVARRLELPAERVWSQTSAAGNLGSASLPIAWVHGGKLSGPVVWAAIGAGLTLASALSLGEPAA